MGFSSLRSLSPPRVVRSGEDVRRTALIRSSPCREKDAFVSRRNFLSIVIEERREKYWLGTEKLSKSLLVEGRKTKRRAEQRDDEKQSEAMSLSMFNGERWISMLWNISSSFARDHSMLSACTSNNPILKRPRQSTSSSSLRGEGGERDVRFNVSKEGNGVEWRTGVRST